LRHDVEPSREGLAEPLVEGVEEDGLSFERQKLETVFSKLAKGKTNLEQVKSLEMNEEILSCV